VCAPVCVGGMTKASHSAVLGSVERLAVRIEVVVQFV